MQMRGHESVGESQVFGVTDFFFLGGLPKWVRPNQKTKNEKSKNQK
jgi:hypothetical protein